MTTSANEPFMLSYHSMQKSVGTRQVSTYLCTTNETRETPVIASNKTLVIVYLTKNVILSLDDKPQLNNAQFDDKTEQNMKKSDCLVSRPAACTESFQLIRDRIAKNHLTL